MTTLEQMERNTAAELEDLATRGAEMAGSDTFDPDNPSYVAIRESTERLKLRHTELQNMLKTRGLARAAAPILPRKPAASDDMARVLREYDRGNSDRFNVSYDLRELTTDDPYFQSNPTRIQVATLPTVTPSLDLVRTVAVGGQNYDFVVPPPLGAAATVPEGGKKPTVNWISTPVSGSLETDALIIDVSRATLEDDATAERTLRAWLVDSVRKRQDAKVAAAITGATGTGTASGTSIAEGLRNGKAELSELGLPATAAYMNPADAAKLDLDAMDANGSVSGVGTVWGMRIVESTAVAVNAPIVGAMSTAVYLLYRNSISTYLTDSGMTDEVTPRDRFSHNLIGILGEGRSKAHVVFPQGLVKVTVTPPVFDEA